MCVAMAALGPLAAAVSAVGTVVSFAAQMQQAKTQEAIAERNAKLEEQRGRYEAKQLERKLRYTQGKALVGAAANGIGINGTFLDIIADNEVQGEIDMENAKRNAYNRSDSITAEGQAAAARSRAGAVGTLIDGTGTFLKMVA